jgi:D-alanine-D-alanine ligase
MKKLRVLALMNRDLIPPDSIEGLTDEQMAPWKMEYDVVVTLNEIGHETLKLGVADDLAPLRAALGDFKPHVVFNLLEEFNTRDTYVAWVLGYLELMNHSYTGCNPAAMLLTMSKAMQKRVLRSQRIPVPNFAIFPLGRAIRRPRRLPFPLIVKSLSEHGSVGIAQSSIVHDDEKLRERVAFIHEQVGTDAIAEQYIEGRELYVGVLGNERLITFPIWEMTFSNLPEGAPRIATEKVKWSHRYQIQSGVSTGPAADLSPEQRSRIVHLCKRTYRALGQTGYARIDLRMDVEGHVYVLESNPNPQLAYGEDFAESAHVGGISYEDLLQRILNLGIRQGR